MVRTRFAPSPTGYMHIGNLRTAIYEYLIAKNKNGQFILRIEDTDQGRFVEGATEIIYNTLKTAGIKHDEGPDVGGAYGPYVQSERRDLYIDYAKKLVAEKKAYYCFCTKERLDQLHKEETQSVAKYDRHCADLPKEIVEEKLANQEPFVIRQYIPQGSTAFHDVVYGNITVENDTLDDQILIKSDGMPTYNFANVIDDHLMKITHVVRGSEYLSSTPKYNLLYEAFNWEIPEYVHLPLIMNQSGDKLSKRKGDASFEDLLAMGYLPEAIVNYIVLLGWSPADNREFFTLAELCTLFDEKNISKSPSAFDIAKLTWMNGEYIKNMAFEDFYVLAEPVLRESIKRTDVDLKYVGAMVQSRIEFIKDIKEKGLVDFVDALPSYETDLYIHKKMKTTKENSLSSLKEAVTELKALDIWTEKSIHDCIFGLIEKLNIKNGLMLWPLRTALSGKPSSPCGATELLALLGKEDSIKRIEYGIEILGTVE